MNKEELRMLLIKKRIKESYYDLDGNAKNEALILTAEDGNWCVYYSERGQQSGKVCYGSEDAACRGILDSLLEDPSARETYVPPPFVPSDKL